MTESSSGGRGTPLGGISPARNLRRMMSQPSRLLVREAGCVKAEMSTPPDARFSLWKGVQGRESKGGQSKGTAPDSPVHFGRFPPQRCYSIWESKCAEAVLTRQHSRTFGLAKLHRRGNGLRFYFDVTACWSTRSQGPLSFDLTSDFRTGVVRDGATARFSWPSVCTSLYFLPGSSLVAAI